MGSLRPLRQARKQICIPRPSGALDIFANIGVAGWVFILHEVGKLAAGRRTLAHSSHAIA